MIFGGTSMQQPLGIGWIVAATQSGYELRDVLFGIVRFPGRLGHILLWPHLIGLLAAGALLAVVLQSWSGRVGAGEQFLVIAVLWLVLGRSILSRTVQLRYLADVWILWEMLAAMAVCGLLAWANRGTVGRARPRAVALGGVLLAAHQRRPAGLDAVEEPLHALLKLPRLGQPIVEHVPFAVVELVALRPPSQQRAEE